MNVSEATPYVNWTRANLEAWQHARYLRQVNIVHAGGVVEVKAQASTDGRQWFDLQTVSTPGANLPPAVAPAPPIEPCVYCGGFGGHRNLRGGWECAGCGATRHYPEPAPPPRQPSRQEAYDLFYEHYFRRHGDA